MKRREFITVLGGAAAWPLAARAQQTAARMRRIAVLLRVAQDDPDTQRDLQNLRKGLWELGWTVGSNILIEYHYASANPAQMQSSPGFAYALPDSSSGVADMAALRGLAPAQPSTSGEQRRGRGAKTRMSLSCPDEVIE